MAQTSEPNKQELEFIEMQPVEQTQTIRRDEDGRIITGAEGFSTEEDLLPKGYFYSPSFIGSVFAIGLGFWAAVSAFSYVVPVLSTINQDIGPDPNITWVAMIHTVALSCGLTIVGRLGDIFGRRWFFICGAAVAAGGTLVSALAVNVPMLIVGSTIKGLAAATQMSVFYAITELVPMKHRYLAIAMIYVFNIPGTAMAPLIAQAFVTKTGIGWRGFFFVITGANVASGLCYFFFYHPPDFKDKHGKRESKLEWVKNFDYIGALLYAAGLVLFLLGVSWGGKVYPWKSAPPLCAIVIGALSMISFFLWEIYAKPKEPLISIGLFKSRPWVTSAVLSGIGSGTYYSSAIVWPVATQKLWANGNVMYGAALAVLPGALGLAGQMFGGAVARPIGKQKWQVTATAFLAGAFLAALSVLNAERKATACILMSLATFFKGWLESVAIANTIIAVEDQRTLGAAAGMGGAVRTSIASICQTAYTSILNARLATTVPAAVGPAVVAAGLPATSVPAFIKALNSGGAFTDVEGLTASIRATGVAANKDAYAMAFKTVFLSSIAFTALGIIAAVLSPNLDDKMTGKMSTTLRDHKEKREVDDTNKLQ